MNLKDKTCLVHDFGLFEELAIRLARDFKKVYYFAPWVSAFSEINEYMIGVGVPDFERVHNFWDYVDKADMIVFTDIHSDDMQDHLRKQGKAVFGLGKAEILELDRFAARLFFEEEGLPVPETDLITGIDNLKDHLKNVEDRWVKLSRFRGNWESFHHIDPSHTEPFLDSKSAALGLKKRNLSEFIVEEPIDGVEIGYDGYCVKGEFPDMAAYGIEVKDLGYIGFVVEYDDLPEQLQITNDPMAKVIKEANGMGAMSSEVRVTPESVGFLTDPTMRHGSPPTEVMQEAWANLGQIYWDIAHGDVPELEPNGKVLAEVMVYSEWAKDHWTKVSFPKKYRDSIKLRNFCVIDGEYWIIPQRTPIPVVCSVVAVGNTIEEVSEMLKEISESIDVIDKDVKHNFLETALSAIEKGREYGIKFPGDKEDKKEDKDDIKTKTSPIIKQESDTMEKVKPLKNSMSNKFNAPTGVAKIAPAIKNLGLTGESTVSSGSLQSASSFTDMYSHPKKTPRLSPIKELWSQGHVG